jgi:hypothetical protein
MDELQQEQAVPEQNQEAEKLIPQSKVNELVGQARIDAHNRAMQGMQQQQPSSMGGMDGMTEERIAQLIDHVSEQKAQKQHAEQLAQSFISKMQSAEGDPDMPDFKEKVSAIDFERAPDLIRWANGFDNTAKVIYDIASNPAKFANITMLTHTQPKLALRELQKLSESIAKNEVGKEAPAVSAPLDQLRPSTIGTDSGVKSITDLRRNPKYRG